jgi:gluconolactonase
MGSVGLLRLGRMKILLLSLVGFAAIAADFVVVDAKAFGKLFPKNAKVEKLATGMQFIEGPVWIAKEKRLIFSDIPADELKQWTRTKGVQTYRKPSNNANGNTLDRKGNLVSAEHTAHRLSRTTLAKGKVESLVEQFEGRDLNSPNDVVEKSDGSLWFTDPDYGLGQRKKMQAANNVYRLDPATKELTAVAKDFDKPNGICFAPGERKLYIADSGAPRHIRVFAVNGTTVSGGEVFAKIDKGGPDGIRCDKGGNVWSSSGDGAQVFGSDGKLIARILLPEAAANLEIADGMLFLTARTSLYAVPIKARKK